MTLGFEQAGFDIAACVEYDPIHCAVHKFNFPNCSIFCRRAEDVSAEALTAAADPNNRGIDVLFGGPPCQGFSMIGKRALDDPRNSLVKHFIDLVVETSARYFVLENVPGLAVGKHRAVLLEAIREFRGRGYNVKEPWRILNSLDFGVPQDRERIFLLGARKGFALPTYPLPTTSAFGEGILGGRMAPTVGEALGDLPDAEAYDELIFSDCARVKYGRPSRYASYLRGLTDDPRDFSYPRIYDSTIITSSLRTSHTDESRRRFAETALGSTEPISRFFKLDPDGFCNTLRAGTASDRGAFTSPRPIHPFYPRCITVREAARLHSYPDWFRFHVTKWHGARQVGNSVPPLLARAVAESIAEAFGYKPEKPTEAIVLKNEPLLEMNMQTAAAFFGSRPDVIPQRIRK
jgi:DNA (cytosine-5)-methyltransferase 1